MEKKLLAKRKVIKETNCWEWTGSRGTNQYGHISCAGKSDGVHRVAAWVWNGFDLSSDLLVRHRCDNPPCFNPDHVLEGTYKDNAQDVIVRGRGKRWGWHKKAKTTCPKGHLYSLENTRINSRGARVCKTCRSALDRRRYEDRWQEIYKDRYEKWKNSAPRRKCQCSKSCKSWVLRPDRIYAQGHHPNTRKVGGCFVLS